MPAEYAEHGTRRLQTVFFFFVSTPAGRLSLFKVPGLDASMRISDGRCCFHHEDRGGFRIQLDRTRRHRSRRKIVSASPHPLVVGNKYEVDSKYRE